MIERLIAARAQGKAYMEPTEEIDRNMEYEKRLEDQREIADRLRNTMCVLLSSQLKGGPDHRRRLPKPSGWGREALVILERLSDKCTKEIAQLRKDNKEIESLAEQRARRDRKRVRGPHDAHNNGSGEKNPDTHHHREALLRMEDVSREGESVYRELIGQVRHCVGGLVTVCAQEMHGGMGAERERQYKEAFVREREVIVELYGSVLKLYGKSYLDHDPTKCHIRDWRLTLLGCLRNQCSKEIAKLDTR